MTETITKVTGHSLPNGDYVEITAQLRGDGNVVSAGFSVTGQVWETRGKFSGRVRKRMRYEADGTGQIRDEIKAADPSIQPLLDVHLAKPDGTPLYAVDNGWYIYSGKLSAYERANKYETNTLSDHVRCAKYLKIQTEQLPQDLDQDSFTAFVESLRPHYAALAVEALTALQARVHGAGMERRP